MGINISATNFVAFDDTHQRRVNTSLDANPTVQMLDDIRVHHIFQRNNDGDLNRDGNPLVKAMKGMDGFRIMPIYRTQFMTRARLIVEGFAGDLEVDAVLPMPSSYGFSREVAELLSDVTGKELIEPSFLRKRTIGEMLAQYDGNVPDDLNKKRRDLFKHQLGVWQGAAPGQLVSMKRIDPKIRSCFQPLCLTEDVPDLGDRRILIVDDLLATGSSIVGVASLLRDGIGCPTPSAVCFLSGL